MKLRPYQIDLPDGRKIERRAWTGGRSASYSRSHPCYYLWLDLSCHMFAEQVDMWRAYWGDEPSMDTLNIFWDRAKADAYATISGALYDGFQFTGQDQ